MAVQQYSAPIAARSLFRAELKMLKHVEGRQVLGMFGDQKEQPLRKSDTVIFRRLKPFNANANETPNIDPATLITTEGTTPTANTIDYTDVSLTLRQYAVLFSLTSKAELMYEDDIPGDMVKLTGETLAECAELVAFGQIKAGLQVLYSSGTTRANVNQVLSLNLLRQAVRTLEMNRASKVSSAIAPGVKTLTRAVEESYAVFISTESASDVRNIDGFTKRVEYGTAVKPLHKREIGAVEEFRFITSPLFAPFLGAGSATTNGMVHSDSGGGDRVDVFPTVILAEHAMAHLSLKGHGYTGISPTYLPPSKKSHFNPSGMFGFVGADFWYNCGRLNENWLLRIEHGVTQLV